MNQTPTIALETLRKVAVNASEIRDGDRDIITAQLGRYPRGLVGIGARCACGNPAVTITYPRLPDGTPFPTLFYLSLPSLVKEISRIESAGGMVPFNDRLAEDPEYRDSHEHAHAIYVERREVLDDVPEITDRSAGGMPDRVKCLHALAGYALAVGPGITKVGDEALEAAGWDPQTCRCTEPAVDETDPGGDEDESAGDGPAKEGER
ncbi:hypothetical protein J2S70_000704 [Trueperella bonasi]|uniref:DUF501 domain-containing protein n=1 Tax=Trueperella bonasi TaxID=312286 RepID=A0ABT9NFH2_9ACTO|nr:DUF501 domain-containing protein [Trueperella bonasi]MDP9806122.1 hypothetical protein [Trueperella bonasi]